MFYLMSAVELVGVKNLFAHLKALEMRMQKLVLDLSVAQILPGKINKIFLPKKLGFIDVLPTVLHIPVIIHESSTPSLPNRVELSELSGLIGYPL